MYRQFFYFGKCLFDLDYFYFQQKQDFLRNFLK